MLTANQVVQFLESNTFKNIKRKFNEEDTKDPLELTEPKETEEEEETEEEGESISQEDLDQVKSDIESKLDADSGITITGVEHEDDELTIHIQKTPSEEEQAEGLVENMEASIVLPISDKDDLEDLVDNELIDIINDIADKADDLVDDEEEEKEEKEEKEEEGDMDMTPDEEEQKPQEAYSMNKNKKGKSWNKILKGKYNPRSKNKTKKPKTAKLG